MNQVKEQFERIKRWHSRLERLATEQDPLRGSDYYQDVLYTFYQNCWHLKDWVKNSQAVDKQTVEDFFTKNETLKLCQALAIGSKHLIITNRRVDSRVKVRKQTIIHLDSRRFQQFKVVFNVRAPDGRQVEALALASQCVELCEKFLLKHDLLGLSLRPIYPRRKGLAALTAESALSSVESLRHALGTYLNLKSKGWNKSSTRRALKDIEKNLRREANKVETKETPAKKLKDMAVVFFLWDTINDFLRILISEDSQKKSRRRRLEMLDMHVPIYQDGRKDYIREFLGRHKNR